MTRLNNSRRQRMEPSQRHRGRQDYKMTYMKLLDADTCVILAAKIMHSRRALRGINESSTELTFVCFVMNSNGDASTSSGSTWRPTILISITPLPLRRLGGMAAGHQRLQRLLRRKLVMPHTLEPAYGRSLRFSKASLVDVPSAIVVIFLMFDYCILPMTILSIQFSFYYRNCCHLATVHYCLATLTYLRHDAVRP
jgi:hypothetical protein